MAYRMRATVYGLWSWRGCRVIYLRGVFREGTRPHCGGVLGSQVLFFEGDK